MARRFKVWFEIEEANSGEASDRLEVASFKSLTEARFFCVEMQQRFVHQATGESEVSEEVNCPETNTLGG